MASCKISRRLPATEVACFAAKTAGPDATITSTLSRANSAAISEARSLRPSAQRYSIATVRPSFQPSSRSRCSKAAAHCPAVEGVCPPRNPMTGSFPACCARAASGHVAAAPPSMRELEEVETAARALGIETIALKIRQVADIASAFEALKNRAQALYVVGEPLTSANRVRINSFALAARLPTMVLGREIVETGGLMSYGPNFPSLYRRAGDLVDKILRGAKPADIPVEQPTKLDLVINLITAQAIGLGVPPTLLARADEVIE